MAEAGDARNGQLDQAEFKKKMMSQLATTGVVGQVKSQLRAQLLSQLQKGNIVQLGPPPGDRPGLKRHALNSMIADYMGTVQYNYSLSVFKEESGVESRPLLTEDELLDVLKIDRELSFYQSYMKAKAHGGSDSCFILNLLCAISEAAAAKGKESCTQTVGGDRYQLEVRMQQLDQEYHAKLRSARMAPSAGLEERLALYRQEIEEQAAAEVARQVERIREMEVAAARLDEAAKCRRALEAERLELDRLHSERLAKLRGREEEMLDKLRRQQRDVENVAYEHRQRILREEERLRNGKNEIQLQQDSRQEQLKQLERSLELRERAVASREAAAEKKIAEATEAAAEAQVAARQDVEREYIELKSGLQQQRMQLEMDRSRILELRSEATAEIATARAKEERLRSLETARAEAEARAAAHAADAEICRLQAEKLAMELSQARDELSRRLAHAADGADAMLQNAAGAMNMLNAEAAASRAAGSQIRDALSQLERAREEAAAASAVAVQLQQERGALHAALAASGAEAEAMRTQLSRVESLMDEAVAARAEALSAVEEGQFRVFQMERELSELRGALARAKEELAALKMHATTRRPPSRGADSPGRRSIALSPSRRAAGATGTASAVFSALSLALGNNFNSTGGSTGGGGGHSNHYGWPWNQSGGGGGGGGSSGMAGGTPALSNAEFPIAAAPRDATLERLDRLRRQEDIVASQEESYRKRMSSLQEVRERSVAILGQPGSAQLLQQQHQFQQHQPPALQLPMDGTDTAAPYMTYVMHSSSPRQQPQHGPQFLSPTAAAAAEAQAHAELQQHLMFAYQHNHQRHLQQQQQQQHEDHEEQQLQRFQQQQQQQQHLQEHLQQHEHLTEDQFGYPYDDHTPPLGSNGPPHLSQHYNAGQALYGSGASAPGPAAAAAGQPVAGAAASLPQASMAQPPPAQFAPRISAAVPSRDGGLTPPQEISYRVHEGGMQQQPGSSASGGGGGGGALSSHASSNAAPDQPGGGGGGEPAPAAALPPPSTVLPPPGLVLTSNLWPQNTMAAASAFSAPARMEPPAAVAPADPSPPKPTIPGLVIVSGFAPRGPATSVAPQMQMQPVEDEEPQSPPPPQDVESVMQAKMRMLQEQRERALAAQQQQQQHPSAQRLTSRASMSSRVSVTSHSSGGGAYHSGGGAVPAGHHVASASGGNPVAAGGSGGGPQPRDEDSTSDVIAGEAYDTVAPELSTVQRRTSVVRRRSHEGMGAVSRQSSVNRRELSRGASTIRSETSGMSVEAPGLATSANSQRALSVGMTTMEDESLDNYVVHGYNEDDDDDGMEAPGDSSYAFTTEFSAGSVF